jgi:hypothetical protein
VLLRELLPHATFEVAFVRAFLSYHFFWRTAGKVKMIPDTKQRFA